MTNYQISISNKSICQRTLTWLHDHSEINAKGLIQVELSINGMGANQVLMGVVDFHPAIPDGTKSNIIQQALTQWRQDRKLYNSDDPVKTFKQTLTAKLKNLEMQKSSFTILAFLNVEQKVIESLFPITIQGNTLQLPTWSGLDHLNLDEFWEEVEIFLGSRNKTPLLKKVVTEKKVHYFKQTQDFTPITVELRSIDANTALYTAIDALELFRAVSNLPSSLRLFLQIGSGDSSLSKFLPSPVYGVFNCENGEYKTLYFTSRKYNYKRQTMSVDDVKSCSDWINNLKSASQGDLKHLLIQAIKLYQKALDFTEYQDIYFGLWQSLEVLTLNEPSHGRAQIDKRISCLLGLQGDEVLTDAIKILVKSRNALVHSGIFPEYAHELVFTLKGIIDAMLKQIMILSTNMSTKSELREYYRLVSKSNADLMREASDLEMTKGVIKFIQDSRNNN